MRDRVPAALILGQAERELHGLRAAFELSDRPHQNVHSARKSIRRLRSILALLGRDDGGMLLLDSRLQAMASGLSALRDAHVARELVCRLADEEANEDASQWMPSIGSFIELEQKLLKQALMDDPGFERHRIDVDTLSVILRTSCTCHLGAHQIRHALERSERRVEKAKHQAHRHPESDSIHRWRRKARRLKMQLQTIARLDDHAQSRLALHARNGQTAELGKVVDALGHIQDLYLLRTLVGENAPKDNRASLISKIDVSLTHAAYDSGYFASPICLASKAQKETDAPAPLATSVLSIRRTASSA